jgi:hypothetical protein
MSTDPSGPREPFTLRADTSTRFSGEMSEHVALGGKNARGLLSVSRCCLSVSSPLSREWCC